MSPIDCEVKQTHTEHLQHLALKGFAHHGVAAVGGRTRALADDFFDAFLVDRRIAFWVTHNR